MIKFFFIVLCSSIWSVFSQDEQANYAGVAAEFRSLYNGGNYDGIFDLFDVNMKKALPRQKTIRFFTENVNGIMGGIKNMQFYGLKQGAHIYRTGFDRAVADVLISLDAKNNINGLYISPPKSLDVPILERNSTQMILPFNEEWFVFWGGTTVEQNYHLTEVSQQYAYDLMMVEDGASFSGDAMRNESYFVFGKEIIAPCDARVAKVVSGIPDNVPGETNSRQLTGNTVVLETLNNEYVLLAHLKDRSIVVREGQFVKQGELLGLCGNSGNSTEPHLHLSLQNAPDMEASTGAKLYFDSIVVNGEDKEDYLPVKEDFIKNNEKITQQIISE
ncbi:peptidoglycan DD-metalloendopeptidase family protein [uncultured Kriegella sp.]|uniref:peptidoglycan DD-metalloendopeptidase family protein n=1 Tax=uncultured Kriegella sp. TaxID=1798910 RepID=UPI0030DD73F8|tara:strand:+ start:178683 stop:179675 length:993 start_codon:yes stop_codon:yes gene_type:complete